MISVCIFACLVFSLFLIMGLFIGIIAPFFGLFFLFFLFFPFCECACVSFYACSYLLSVAFTIFLGYKTFCLSTFCLSILFLFGCCLTFFYHFLSFSLLCCVACGVLVLE